MFEDYVASVVVLGLVGVSVSLGWAVWMLKPKLWDFGEGGPDVEAKGLGLDCL